MTLQDLKDTLIERGYENAVVFENPNYLSAVIGISQNGQVIYSYEKMVEHLMEEDEMEEEDAIEFIDYNTIRALPYMGDNAPIISYDIF